MSKPAAKSSGDGPGILAALAPLAVPIDSIEVDEGNPNQGNVKAVAASLRRFGQRKPVIVRASSRVVSAGNTTLLAARRLGWSEVAAVLVDDDEAEAIAFGLADNRSRDLTGGYDEDRLAEALRLVSGDTELLAATSWTSAEVAKITGLDAPAALTDRDEAPRVPKRRPKTKVGDVWELGPHRLVCGDATSGATYRLLLGKGMVDAVWTDPPYGVEVEGEAGSIMNDEADADKLENEIIRPALSRALQVCRPGGAWYVACPMGTTLAAFIGPLLELGVWRQTIIWVKDSLVMGRADYHWRHEGVLYGWAPGAEPDPLPDRTDGLAVGNVDLSPPRGDDGSPADPGDGSPRYVERADAVIYGWAPGAAHHPMPDRKQDTVWEIPRPRRNPDHPTMKPVDLVSRALRNSTDLDAVVLDPFGGSGTTLIACHHTGRVARLIELDPKYCDAICRRFQEHTGEVPRRKGIPVDFTKVAR